MISFHQLEDKSALFISSWLSGDDEGKKRLSTYKDPLAWHKLINGKTRFGFIILDDSLPVGFIDLEKSSAQTASFAFYIAREFRGKGLGKKTVLELISLAKNLGLKNLVGTTEKDNFASQAVLKTSGFVQNGEDKDGFFIFSKQIS